MLETKKDYKCKACGLNFVEKDAEIDQSTIIKRALAVILYSLGKANFSFIVKLFGIHKTQFLKQQLEELKWLAKVKQ